MAELTKFHLTRPVQLLTPEAQAQITTSTHQDGTTSTWFQQLLALCKLRDHAQMYQMALDFLTGAAALQSFDQLDPFLTRVIGELRKGGRKAVPSISPQLADAYINDPKSAADKQAIEDTMLALAIIGKLGNKRNLNYQLAHKAFQMLEVMSRTKNAIQPQEMAVIWAKPITLPTCVYNACTKKYVLNEPFPHLDLNPSAVVGPNQPRAGEGQGQEDPCECNCESEGCNDQNPCCPELRFFVSDLMVLREDLACYEPKHLAYIENIMAGEKRERIHRNLERTETFTETETETTRSQEKDHTVEDQFSLKSAVQKTIQEDLGISAGVEFSGDFGVTKFAAHVDFAYDLAKSESSQIAQEYARKVTTRAVSKVEEKVRELKSTRQLKETEETNTHTFQNESTSRHIIGQYFFVNMKSRAQVMNYGKRMMLEIVVPEPMELYKKLLQKEVLPSGLVPPVRPDFLPHDILDAPSNDPRSFSYLIDKWGLTGVEPLPDADIRLPFSFDSILKAEGSEPASFTFTLATIPKGYNGRGLKVELHSYNPSDNTNQEIEWFIDGLHQGPFAGHNWYHNENQTPAPPIDAHEGSTLTISFLCKSINRMAASGFILCLLSEQAKMEWKTSIFEKVMAAYQRQLEEYNTAKARYEQEKNAKLPFGRNPFLNRDIERTELKRLAISHISCQFYDRFTAMRRNVKPCGYPEMDLEQAQRDGAFIQFFEQTFEWNLMNYLFYPYFWGQKCSWAEKVQQVSNDPLFDKALSAGAARIQVPVRLGHESLALYWSYFGEIWMGADQPPVAGSPYYVSMIQEIKEQKNCFYVDRPGTLTVTPGIKEVTLTYANPESAEYINDPTLIEADIDREIMINCEVYRITKIEQLAPIPPVLPEFKITLDRDYVGAGCCGCETPTNDPQPYRTGAVYIGGPFEVIVPTNLVTLRNRTVTVGGEPVMADCLPCYPLDKCE